MTDPVVWDGLAAACADLCPVEVAEDLRQAYKECLINPEVIAWDEVTEALEKGPKATLEEVRHRFCLSYMSANSCFKSGQLMLFDRPIGAH